MFEAAIHNACILTPSDLEPRAPIQAVQRSMNDDLLHSSPVQAPSHQGGACLIVHGGAWAIPNSEVEGHEDGLEQAIRRGKDMLLNGASALETVVETVALMEGHGAFDAGCGSVLTREGHAELDAGVMDGTSLAFGAVACVRRLLHPVRTAASLARGDGSVRLMVGEAAERFAVAGGQPLVDPARLISTREQARFQTLRAQSGYHPIDPFLPDDAPRGTVGCVARDREGHLAAATSTGGTPFRPAGRVGDTPLPGGGFYATPTVAVSGTGFGEALATVLLCARAADTVEAGQAPEAAARARLQHMHGAVRTSDGNGAAGGLIVLDASGRGAWAFTTPRMARGGWSEGRSAWWSVLRSP